VSRSEAGKERSEGENEEGARKPRYLERALQTAILEQRFPNDSHPGPMRLAGGLALGPLLSGASGIKPVAHTGASFHKRRSAVPNTVLVTREPPIAVVQLNRPDVLNALNEEVMGELVAALEGLDDDGEIRCIVLTGNERAFAAGADIKDTFVTATPVTMLAQDLTTRWEAIRRVNTPIIAAVSGFALGGGCELAMTCDIIVASETAKFGQPEINLGIIPGAGGTQRLTRAVGKWVANEIILTGRFVGAPEAKAIGLVAQVYPAASWLEDAKTLARTIAEKAPVAARLATEAVDLAWNSTLDAGLEFERKAFYLLFATEDKKEGVDAFVNKRKPSFKGK
jgi:enoyl-CoA hydratase